MEPMARFQRAMAQSGTPHAKAVQWRAWPRIARACAKGTHAHSIRATISSESDCVNLMPPDPASYTPVNPRARIGFIIPSSNRMVEPQMHRYMPAGVVPHVTRIRMTNRHKAPLDQLVPRIVAAAELLVDSKCDVTVLQCT